MMHDWLHLLIRWAHFVAGIMWIGTSFYFVWLDSSFQKTPTEKKGVDGEVWMVHGGNFYHVQKRRFGPGEMPKPLHWFIWEATFTWITGFVLMFVVYYFDAHSFLIDPAKMKLTAVQATSIGLAFLFGGWACYELIYRSFLANTKWVNAVVLALFTFLIYGLLQVFSGRGAFIHFGALLGTIMVLNVWIHILPNQRAIISASDEGKEPDYNLGIKAKRRSMHNSYMTLPVLLIMISNHFSFLYSHSLSWIILVLIIVLGASIRHFMITLNYWTAVPTGVALMALVFMTTDFSNKAQAVQAQTVHPYQVNHIVQIRCVQCHSQFATDQDFKVAPNGLVFDQYEQIVPWAQKISERVYVQKNMPLANKTGMTDAERQLLHQWAQEVMAAK